MAALEGNDFERFARAMGVDQPSRAYLAAASAAAGLPGNAGQSPANQSGSPQTDHPGGGLRR
jgi:hypothetical protein